jgi:hypothetical protein
MEKVPPDFLIPFGPVQDILKVLTVLGLALAALYSIKTLTPKANPANLAASVGLEFAGFYIFLFFIGLGDPASLGRVEKAISTGPGVTLVFDFRVFVLLLLAVLAFKVVVALLEFYHARGEPATGKAKRGQNA